MERIQNQQAKLWGKLVSRCWADEAFKQRFIAEPAAVMKEAGLEVPEGVEFKVVENKDKVQYILIPAKPGQLSDEQLAGMSGGSRCLCWPDSETAQQTCSCNIVE